MNFKLLYLLLILPLSSLTQELADSRHEVEALFKTDKEAALEISENSLPLAFAEKDTFHITYFLDQAGEINRIFNRNYEAKEQLKKCLRYKVNWTDLKDLSLTHNNLGKTYIQLSRYDLAAEHFLIALKLMEEDNNLMGQGFYLNNLGVLFDLQQNYTKAIFYYKQSMAIKKEINDTIGVGSTSINIGISYSKMQKYDEAYAYFKTAQEKHQYLENRTRYARALFNLGSVSIKMGLQDQAKKHILESLATEPLVDDNYLKSGLFSGAADYFLEFGPSDSAHFFNEKAFEFMTGSGAGKKLQDLIFQKANIFQKEKLYDSAFHYLKLGNAYNDSTLTTASIRAVSEMESKYQFEKQKRLLKEQELEQSRAESELKDEKIKLYVVIGLAAILSALALLIFSRYKSKKKLLRLEQDKNSLIQKQNSELAEINQKVKSELDKTLISLEDKQRILDNVFSKPKEMDLPPEIKSLSAREMEVLSHLALGWSDEQLAEKLFISKSTVKTHLRRIYSKLLVKNRAEAVMIAHKHGLIGKKTDRAN